MKEAAAIVQAHRADATSATARLRVREEEIRRRNTDLVYLLRRARKYEATAKRTQQTSNLDPATLMSRTRPGRVRGPKRHPSDAQ